MNCADCRNNLAAFLEGLLEAEERRQCQAHLQNCAACRAERDALTRLRERLVAGGLAGAEVALVEPVMQRIRQMQTKPERITFMNRIMNHHWSLGLGAAASAAAVIFLVLVLATPNARAKAADVMARGAQAVAGLTSVHLQGQLRTYPQDNFGAINPDGQFVRIELWKQLAPDLKWRIEKPERAVVMDGRSTVMFIKTTRTAVNYPQRTTSAFDTEWLHRIANLSNTLTNELRNALARGWQLSLSEVAGADGRLKAVVTVRARSGVPDNDYGKNTFIENADTRRVYRFDSQSELLEAVQVYLERPAGEVQIFDLSQIDYNQPMAAETWKLDLPADVTWTTLPQDLPNLPDNGKYSSMTAEQAARAFLEACGREDWTEAGKFFSPINDRFKAGLGGLEIISLGQSFDSTTYPGRFVPYEIKLRSQEFAVRVSNANPAKRFVITGACDQQLRLLQDLAWTNPPTLLPNNDGYARQSPLQAVQSYFAAAARLDWEEMGKYAPDYDVASDKAQIEAAKKQGMDLVKLMPTREAVEAVQSAEPSVWFVKCRMLAVRKANLALRKDNPVGRWQVDGGI
jgi:hypothetical protein